MMKEAILEIGTEEIPVRFLISLEEKLRDIVSQELSEKKLKYKKIDIFLTIRRIIIILDGLHEKCDDEIIELLGPPIKDAISQDGSYLKPALRFAESYGVNPEEIIRKKTDKGEYLCIIKRKEGQKTESVLPEIFRNIIKKINFPKTMMWEDSCFKFARPIRWIYAMYGTRKVKFSIADVESQIFTYGLQNLSSKKIKIRSTREFIYRLKNSNVISDQNERREIIKKILTKLARRIGAEPLLKESLLDELVYLNEYPVGILCKLNENFMNLPSEILLNCLEKKQKFVPVVDDGKLKPYFIGFKDGISEKLETVKKWFETVVTARLNDAEFYFKKDLSISPMEFVTKLKTLQYREGVGTMYEKTQRLIRISEFLCERLKCSIELTELTKKAAELSKFDLLTSMVYEYPELCGTMGKIYYMANGGDHEVALAIEEQYLPRPGDSKLPETMSGTILSLADKIDSVVSAFYVGYKPTGYGDPYGVRGDAIDFLKIVIAKKLSFSLLELIRFVISVFNFNDKNIFHEVVDFFKARFCSLLTDYKQDEIDSVLCFDFDDITTTVEKIKAINSFRSQKDLKSIVLVYKRIDNILKQAENLGYNILKQVDEKILTSDAEKKIFELFSNLKLEVESSITEGKYSKILDIFDSCWESINSFFEDVLVITDNRQETENRLALLNCIRKIFQTIGDFSLIKL